MYLKSIELQGFKSFANKIRFDFHQGITGIVGPNGSGKSNVVDAVRWVLGEQRTKQLRGDSMQDVIFSGTENRRPLSFAVVSITFNNEDHQLPIDYEEVTVTRKLYRSGESEYLINDTPCRLKDINEMFYDTGIGKEGYSIIGQGQIDQILSGKPEDRRELFDEAAGIVKFKRRKETSLKKLEEEQQNLTRVDDILQELENQLQPLEQQADVARDYLRKKEELKTYDINMFLLEMERIQDQIDQVDAKLKGAKAEYSEADENYQDMKNEYEAVEDEMDAVEASIEKAKGQLNETNLLSQQLTGNIDVLKEQINTARTNDEHYGNRQNTIQVEIETREGQIKDLNKEQVDVQAQVKEADQANEKAQKELLEIQKRIAEQSDQIEQNNQQKIKLLNQRSAIQATVQQYDSRREQIHDRQEEIKASLETAKQEEEEQLKLLSEYETQQAKVQEEKESYESQIKKNEEQISLEKDQLTQKQKDFKDSQNAYHREASRLESLKNMTERYEGYGNSIRKVMEKKEEEPGLIGVVADIIQVKKEYEVAVETALGGSIQNIVTDTEETAKKMIEYLKTNHFGRATFLPLSSVSSGEGIRHEEALNEPGVIGLANALVTVEDQFQTLADHLLGRTLVVDHIDTGIAIARKYHQSLRLVTLEGELISPGGSITGGAFKNSSNLLSRRRESEELEKEVVSLKKKMDRLDQETDELREKQDQCRKENDQLQQKLNQVSLTENTIKLNRDQIAERQQEREKQCQDWENEQKSLDDQLVAIENEKDQAQSDLTESDQSETDLDLKNEEQQKSLELEREKESEQLKVSEDAHLSVAGLNQQLKFIQENITRIQDEIRRFNEEMDELNENKGQSSEEINEKEEEITSLRQSIDDAKDLYEEIEAEIQKQTQERDDLNRKHKDFLDKREELSGHMTDLDKEIYRLNTQKESYEESSQKQIDYMWEEYELTYNHAKELRNPNLTDLSDMRKQIQNLKNEIHDLGDVNVNAIEDYKNLLERYDFLKGQHDDLVEGAQSLEKIVDDLDNAMRKQFKEEFAKISEEFDRVFKQLFGGGKGTLELTDAEDVLEAGIRIIAQPPGKKLQSIMQLSGGERALTAIALLFAIQNLKPSPFCFLDEIETSLDDNNVTRFAEYLKKLEENTQFIIITHRRGTMVAADRLYGITMQEKGVSTMVSVDLLEDELEA